MNGVLLLLAIALIAYIATRGKAIKVGDKVRFREEVKAPAGTAAIYVVDYINNERVTISPYAPIGTPTGIPLTVNIEWLRRA